MDSALKVVINNIFRNFNKTVTNIEPIIGHGSVNKIFIVTTEFKSFLKGYGLSDRDYADLEEDLHSLMLLRAIDKLRWAIDKHEVDIPAFTTRIKEFYKMKFK